MELHWELSVLSRAVTYTNLSQASLHVGLSQPQLSRIIQKIEKEMDVVLLDRESRRKSGWTPTAQKIADIYGRSMRHLVEEFQQVIGDISPQHIRVGTLEGLTESVAEFCLKLTKLKGIRVVELDVYDLNELEEHFMKERFDFIFTEREPSRKKFKYIKKLGYQYLQEHSSGSGPKVMSEFEFTSQSPAKTQKSKEPILVSNSLAARKVWVEKHRGRGIIPSSIHSTKTGKPDEVTVLLLGRESLPEKFWASASQQF